MKIKYVGLKPTKEDNVAGTGVIWNGQGDVQSVPDDAAPKLLRFPGVWIKDDTDSAPAPESEVDAGAVSIESAEPSTPDKVALLARAQDLGLKADGRTSLAKLQALIQEAEKVVVV